MESFNCNNNSDTYYSHYKKIGISNLDNIELYGNKLETLNWTEVSNPYIFTLPDAKNDIEDINSVYADIEITSVKLIETPIGIKYYKTALLDEDGNPLYNNDHVVESPCSSAFEITPNAEGICLTGRSLIVSGILNEKVIYTEDILSQSVHSLDFHLSFQSHITVYPKFIDVPISLSDIVVIDSEDSSKTKILKAYFYPFKGNVQPDICEDFSVKSCIEDISIMLLNKRSFYLNTVFFIYALPLQH